MREILFRGKEGDGAWVYGDLATSVSVGRAAILEIEVDPETVGQYTGLKDRNGVKIFEGDVVDIPGFIKGAIFFKDGMFLLRSKNGNFYEWQKFSKPGCRCFLAEVIGNIHDNPELLNRKGGAE
jgi:uncharacterized phage protein (TIGR01671 family)